MGVLSLWLAGSKRGTVLTIPLRVGVHMHLPRCQIMVLIQYRMDNDPTDGWVSYRLRGIWYSAGGPHKSNKNR